MFLSFFLLLSPALEGDSSFSLAWLDSLEELCWLKWLGTWRASPPWEAKLALQPPTTHCKATAQPHVGQRRTTLTAAAVWTTAWFLKKACKIMRHLKNVMLFLFLFSCTGHTRVNHSCTLILIRLQLLLFRDGILMNSATVNLRVTQQRSL